MRLLLLSLLLLSFTLIDTDTDPRSAYPQDYFRSPIPQQTLLLAGTFGELRPNHFHAGIDIKAPVGTPLHAVADGYLAKIEVSGNGYGKALYIAHPNGYTSLYAHMDGFTPEVEAFVKKVQYATEQFEQELILEPGMFVFKKGDKIGAVGLTGATLGPHLHFEIHDTRTGNPINPLLFGFKVKDQTPPRLHELRVYTLDEHWHTIDSKTLPTLKTPAGYRISADTLYVPSERVGFGLKAFDHMDGVHNQNGIYGLSLLHDDSLLFRFEMETFPHQETRYLNAHLDYHEQVSGKGYFYRCFALANNPLPIYRECAGSGVVPLNKARAGKVDIITEDLHGNSSTLTFFAKQTAGAVLPQRPEHDFLLYHSEENMIDDTDLRLYFPMGVLYEDLYMKYRQSEDKSGLVGSATHHLHNSKTPVHDFFRIAIRATKLPEHLRHKAFIAHQKRTNCGGEWDGDWLVSQARALGDYCIMVDTIPPTIQLTTFKSVMKGYKKMAFTISDNFATARNVPRLRYRAEVDGQWILMEHDAKKRLISHTFDGTIKPGTHRLKLTVTDAMGNEKVIERTFTL